MKKIEKKYTIPEVAEMLNIDRTTLYRWMWKGDIKFEKLGSKNRITESELQRFLNSQEG